VSKILDCDDVPGFQGARQMPFDLHNDSVETLSIQRALFTIQIATVEHLAVEPGLNFNMMGPQLEHSLDLYF
jgi:hypothetical protein